MQLIKQENLSFEKIANELKNGKVIVYPTETCYGIGADATNQKAVDEIFAIKKRDSGKSLLVLFPNEESVKNYIDWTPTLEKISKKYWPGALTVIASLKKGKKLAKGVVADDNTVAFRISGNEIARKLSEFLGKPLVSTSANIQAMGNLYDAKEVVDMFKHENHKPDIIIDAGRLPEIPASTIVKIEDSGLKIVRQGSIEVKSL